MQDILSLKLSRHLITMVKTRDVLTFTTVGCRAHALCIYRYYTYRSDLAELFLLRLRENCVEDLEQQLTPFPDSRTLVACVPIGYTT